MGKPMVILSAKEIDKMRIAGRFAAELLDHLGGMLKPGITTQALNDEAEKLTQARKAKSAPLGYHGFPRSICTSVNDVVCHGIPSKEHVLKDGDIINIDVTPIVDGYYGDTSRTFFVGKPTPQAKALVGITLECLKIGIKEVAPGKRVGDIGAAIQNTPSHLAMASFETSSAMASDENSILTRKCLTTDVAELGRALSQGWPSRLNR